jgi:hypothetical protein
MEKSTEEEIKWVFAFADDIESFTLINRFMCGMTRNGYSSSRGAFYLYGEYADTESNWLLDKAGKGWEPEGNLITRDGFLQFGSTQTC